MGQVNQFNRSRLKSIQRSQKKKYRFQRKTQGCKNKLAQEMAQEFMLYYDAQ